MDLFQQNCFNAGAPMAVTTSPLSPPPPEAQKKRRRQQISDDDDVEVIALSVEELNTVTMFPCDLCNKSFIREQNLLLHRRAHNLPFVRNKGPVKNNDDDKRKVYVCPETTCPYHDRPNALSDLTGLRKHYKRMHGEKTLNCTRCEKRYAIESDLKAHLKICGTKEYTCQCGSFFSRSDSFMTHKTVCDRALAQMSSLPNELIQTTQTTVGSSYIPTTFNESISSYRNSQPALNSNIITPTAHFFPLSSTILASPVSNFLSSNQSVHGNAMTLTDPVANNSSAQGNDINIFDIDVLHDRLFGVSSVPAQETPQEGYSFGNLGNPSSLMGSLENSSPAGFDKNNFNVCPNIAMGGRDPVLGDFCNTPGNENIFSTSVEDSTMQNGGPSGFGPNQINQLAQLPGGRVGGDANLSGLENNFCFRKSWGN